MQATGKSFSSVKKWRLKVEELSGHEFTQTKMRVSRRRVQNVYQFTEDEFNKFVRLSERINETNNMAQSVVEIWGNLKDKQRRQLYRDVYTLKNTVEKLQKADSQKDITLSILRDRVKKLEERLQKLEDNQPKGFFSKITNKEKRGKT
ncbi:TPA: hypothetical protein U1C40_001354 [Streptococcus suis]|nr:hypothetical protein [Streptococcus suis]HEM3648728.1 hypothetical protein [Streptococcus suis]